MKFFNKINQEEKNIFLEKYFSQKVLLKSELENIKKNKYKIYKETHKTTEKERDLKDLNSVEIIMCIIIEKFFLVSNSLLNFKCTTTQREILESGCFKERKKNTGKKKNYERQIFEYKQKLEFLENSKNKEYLEEKNILEKKLEIEELIKILQEICIDLTQINRSLRNEIESEIRMYKDLYPRK